MNKNIANLTPIPIAKPIKKTKTKKSIQKSSSFDDFLDTAEIVLTIAGVALSVIKTLRS